jgi:hypothetical protein
MILAGKKPVALRAIIRGELSGGVGDEVEECYE